MARHTAKSHKIRKVEILVIQTENYSLELLLNSKILFQNFASMIFGAIACVMVMPIAAVLMAKMVAVK